MSDRIREEFEDRYWQPGEVRTFIVVNHQRGVVYSGEWAMTVNGTIFGPCNEKWTPIAEYRPPITPTPGRMSR